MNHAEETSSPADEIGAGVRPEPGDPDPVLQASNDLATALRANVSTWMDVLARVDQLRDDRAAGKDYRELVGTPAERTVMEMLAEGQERLALAGARYRRAVVRMMIDQGVPQAQIAKRFGVSRQRVAALLVDEPPAQRGPIDVL